MSPSRRNSCSLVFGMTLILNVIASGAIDFSYCNNAIAIAQEIRILPETNGASEGFSLLYELVWFSLLTQAAKFAALSGAMHGGMSVAKFIIARLN